MTLTEEQREAIRVISKLPMAIGCRLCHPYIMKNYGSHFIVLRAMIDGSSMVEPREGFDLEAARAALVGALKPGGYHDQETARIIHTHMPSLLAEIERLRADMEQSERVIEARLDVIDQQAARIKSLKKEIRRLKHESKVEQEFTNSYIKRLHDAEARIKELGSSLDEAEALTKKNAELMNGYLRRIAELEDALVEERAGAIRCEFYDHCEIDLPDAMIRARQELQADGKIGPDAKPRSWQITKEEKRALSIILEYISYDADDDIEICSHAAVLRAMLREAE